MIPGIQTKLSESVIACSTVVTVKTDVVHITDTTAVTTFTTIQVPRQGGFSSFFWFINRSGNNMATLTTGNIAKAVVIPTNQVLTMVYSKKQNTWYPGPIS